MIIDDRTIVEHCFYCAKPVHPIHLEWRGGSGYLFLHLLCALSFSYRMIRSVKRFMKRQEQGCSEYSGKGRLK